MRFTTRVVALVACLALLAGCGSDARAQSLDELSAHGQSIRDAVSAGNFEAAVQGLDLLRADAWDKFRQGELPQSDLQNLLAAAEKVQSLLPSPAEPPPPPVETNEPDSPEPEAVEESIDEEEQRRRAEEEARQQQEAQRKMEEEARKQQEEARKQAEKAAREEPSGEAKGHDKQADNGEQGDDGDDDD